MRFPKPLAYIDTETTGLDPNIAEVIEVAIIRVDTDGHEQRWQSKIKPERIEDAHPKALEVNGYTAAAWADAPPMSQVGPVVVGMLEGCVLVGHNVSFDERMLKVNMKRAGVEGRIPYHKLDTVTLAFEHLFPLGLKSASLDAIREFLGWSKLRAHRAHTAMKDAEDAKKLHELLSQASILTRLRIRLSRWARGSGRHAMARGLL